MAETGQEGIKTSKRPAVQSRINSATKTLSETAPALDEAKKNKLARSGVAGQLKVERLRRDIKTEQEKTKKAEEEGRIDHMTQLPNRRGILAKLDEEVARVRRERDDQTYTPNYFVVFMDVNNLKQVNDNYGHDSGDKLIIEAGRILMRNKRPTDIVGRWTEGDELLGLIEADDPDEARILWERVAQEFQNYKNGKDGIDMIWISAGLAKLDLDNIDESIGLADRAMHLAKAIAKDHEKHTGKKINMLRTENNLQVPLPSPSN